MHPQTHALRVIQHAGIHLDNPRKLFLQDFPQLYLEKGPRLFQMCKDYKVPDMLQTWI